MGSKGYSLNLGRILIQMCVFLAIIQVAEAVDWKTKLRTKYRAAKKMAEEVGKAIKGVIKKGTIKTKYYIKPLKALLKEEIEKVHIPLNFKEYTFEQYKVEMTKLKNRLNNVKNGEKLKTWLEGYQAVHDADCIKARRTYQLSADAINTTFNNKKLELQAADQAADQTHKSLEAAIASATTGIYTTYYDANRANKAKRMKILSNMRLVSSEWAAYQHEMRRVGNEFVNEWSNTRNQELAAAEQTRKNAIELALCKPANVNERDAAKRCFDKFDEIYHTQRVS